MKLFFNKKDFNILKFMFVEAWISIHSNKLRSFLTTLGIIIGVCAVVLMVAAGETVTKMINKSLSGMGSNVLIIFPDYGKVAGVKNKGSAILKIKDTEIISRLKYIKAVAPIINSDEQVVIGTKNHSAYVVASTPDYMITGNWNIAKGGALSEYDVKAASSYVLIGNTLRQKLFNTENPLGKTIRIRNTPFIVKGVLKSKGQGMGGFDWDEIVIMPITTYRRRIRSGHIPGRVSYIMASIDDASHINRAKIYIKNALRAKQKLKENDEDTFTVEDMTQMQEQIKNIAFYLSILLLAIASISLVVGSIGIMNMMLVSVSERTREIGIRKALGAPNKNILIQFLEEAILISFIGSFIGMLLGVGLSQVAGYVLNKEVPISFTTIIVSFMVALIVGIVSGIFPAIKANKLDPIDALHYQ